MIVGSKVKSKVARTGSIKVVQLAGVRTWRADASIHEIPILAVSACSAVSIAIETVTLRATHYLAACAIHHLETVITDLAEYRPNVAMQTGRVDTSTIQTAIIV